MPWCGDVEKCAWDAHIDVAGEKRKARMNKTDVTLGDSHLDTILGTRTKISVPMNVIMSKLSYNMHNTYKKKCDAGEAAGNRADDSR